MRIRDVMIMFTRMNRTCRHLYFVFIFAADNCFLVGPGQTVTIALPSAESPIACNQDAARRYSSPSAINARNAVGSKCGVAEAALFNPFGSATVSFVRAAAPQLLLPPPLFPRAHRHTYYDDQNISQVTCSAEKND